MRNVITSIFLLGLIVPAHAALTDKDLDIAKIVKEISAKNIEVTIRKLVSFETRNSLSDTTRHRRRAALD